MKSFISTALAINPGYYALLCGFLAIDGLLALAYGLAFVIGMGYGMVFFLLVVAIMTRIRDM